MVKDHKSNNTICIIGVIPCPALVVHTVVTALNGSGITAVSPLVGCLPSLFMLLLFFLSPGGLGEKLAFYLMLIPCSCLFLSLWLTRQVTGLSFVWFICSALPASLAMEESRARRHWVASANCPALKAEMGFEPRLSERRIGLVNCL